MFANLKRIVSNHLINFSGWTTNRKIVVIESDDWGSIRMPSNEVYNRLLREGIRVDMCHYCRYDALASKDDLTHLFETLRCFRDYQGNHPVITANTIVANPDFEKIKSNGFTEYFYEPFTETLKRYPQHKDAFKLWQQGREENLFIPQFHGREHLNVNRWLKSLQAGSKETMLAFNNNLFGISTNITSEKRKSYLASLDFDDKSELDWQKQMLGDGLNLFKTIFGYDSKTFIANNYTWNPEIESHLFKSGILAIQGGNLHIIPFGNNIYETKKHSFGEINQCAQSYLIRNVEFEPSENIAQDWVKRSIKEIDAAFLWNKPAIISSHRVNFIGYIDEKNRTRNLSILKQLLSDILRKWPNIEFMSSDQLADLIQSKT